MPVLPRLLGRTDARLMVLGGILSLAGSCFLDIHLTRDSSGADFIWSQILRGLGQVLALMPLNQASVGAVRQKDAADAAGLFNMGRNLGGSFGVATLGIIIDRRSDLHSVMLRETVTANSVLAQEPIAGMTKAFLQSNSDPIYAQLQALHQISAQIHQQAVIITYSECFWVLGIGLLASLPFILILRPQVPH